MRGKTGGRRLFSLVVVLALAACGCSGGAWFPPANDAPKGDPALYRSAAVQGPYDQPPYYPPPEPDRDRDRSPHRVGRDRS